MRVKLLFILLALAVATPAAAEELRVKKGGIFGFLMPKDPSKAGIFGKKRKLGQSAARAAVKERVEYAVANRPKGRLWCVPFARTVSGVDIRGNAKTWWAQAEGLYGRGHQPKVGAVIAFAPSASSRLGHVGVVSGIVSDREILIDQANWTRNKVTLDDRVIDVSAKGDWSVVRVENTRGTLGRSNRVYGFIYPN